MSTTSTQDGDVRARFAFFRESKTRAWRNLHAAYTPANAREPFGVTMPLHRLLKLLRGA
jgi:DNA-binding transcriptional MocR family regulator